MRKLIYAAIVLSKQIYIAIYVSIVLCMVRRVLRKAVFPGANGIFEKFLHGKRYIAMQTGSMKPDKYLLVATAGPLVSLDSINEYGREIAEILGTSPTNITIYPEDMWNAVKDGDNMVKTFSEISQAFDPPSSFCKNYMAAKKLASNRQFKGIVVA